MGKMSPNCWQKLAIASGTLDLFYSLISTFFCIIQIFYSEYVLKNSLVMYSLINFLYTDKTAKRQRQREG